MKSKDLTGMKIGKLTVLKLHHINVHRQAMWECKCDCGKHIIVTSHNLVRQDRPTLSCGCLRQKTAPIKHGGRYTRLYEIWKNMRQRCFNSNRPTYKNYGGRGITICPEWLEFIPFRDWALQNGYTDTLTIERINVNGNYEPNNCEWIPQVEQANNTTKTVYLTYKGETHTLKEWSALTNIPLYCLYDRRRSHWTTEKLLTQPPRKSPVKH